MELRHRIAAIVLGFIVLAGIPQAFAQNVRRLEEEALLDQERKRRVDELIKARQQEEERIRSMRLTPEEMEAQSLVEVEPNNILPSDLANIYAIVPYKIRRPRWGSSVNVGYTMYTPTSFNSDFADPNLINFENLYGDGGIIELSYAYKFNFVLGSVGIEAAYGIYDQSAEDISFGELELNLQQVRLGVRYTLDNLLYEPYLAPYVGAGVYTMFYSETNGADSFNGQTDPALYFYGGLLLQLNWVDKLAAVEAYTEGGIENTFVYLEGRQYVASSTAQDPDFSTDISVSGGLSIEF